MIAFVLMILYICREEDLGLLLYRAIQVSVVRFEWRYRGAKLLVGERLAGAASRLQPRVLVLRLVEELQVVEGVVLEVRDPHPPGPHRVPAPAVTAACGYRRALAPVAAAAAADALRGEFY